MSDICECKIKSGLKAGKRCTSKAKKGSKYCGRHQNCVKQPAGLSLHLSKEKRDEIYDLVAEKNIDKFGYKKFRNMLRKKWGADFVKLHFDSIENAVEAAVLHKLDALHAEVCDSCRGQLLSMYPSCKRCSEKKKNLVVRKGASPVKRRLNAKIRADIVGAFEDIISSYKEEMLSVYEDNGVDEKFINSLIVQTLTGSPAARSPKAGPNAKIQAELESILHDIIITYKEDVIEAYKDVGVDEKFIDSLIIEKVKGI